MSPSVLQPGILPTDSHSGKDKKCLQPVVPATGGEAMMSGPNRRSNRLRSVAS